MIANYLLAQVFFQAPSSITVPYTFFKAQVEAGNVADVTSVGDSIHGTFRMPVTYLETSQGPTATTTRAATAGDEPEARTLMAFTTQLPTFAGQDLERRLEEHGVVIQAVEEDTSSWFTLLVGFGPTLLLIGAFVLLSRARPRRLGAGSSASGAVAPSGTARRHRRSRSRMWRGSTRPRLS